MIDVKIKLLEGGQLPSKRDEDACYDVVAIGREITPMYIKYTLGFSTEFENTIEGKIRPRSSISDYDLVLCNPEGTIDSGFRGQWQVRFKVTIPTEVVMDLHKQSTEVNQKYNGWIPKIYEVGDKVAQISFNRVNKVNFELVESELASSERGAEGHGSTGV